MENIKVGDTITIEFTIRTKNNKTKRIPKVDTCKVLEYEGQLAVILKPHEVSTKTAILVYIPLSILKIVKHFPK